MEKDSIQYMHSNNDNFMDVFSINIKHCVVSRMDTFMIYRYISESYGKLEIREREVRA
jgi:hypothetical protein